MINNNNQAENWSMHSIGKILVLVWGNAWVSRQSRNITCSVQCTLYSLLTNGLSEVSVSSRSPGRTSTTRMSNLFWWRGSGNILHTLSGQAPDQIGSIGDVWGVCGERHRKVFTTISYIHLKWWIIFYFSTSLSVTDIVLNSLSLKMTNSNFYSQIV